MGLYIKGMRMPEKCGLCDLFHAESPMHCTVVKGHKTVGAPYGMPRPEWCPLVDLGKHGKLIDADALEPDADYDDGEYWAYSVAQVCSAKPVIEAEDI